MDKRFIPISKPSLSDLEHTFVSQAVQSTWVSSLGEYITRFEEDFASFCETKHAISVFNGTVAIHLALHALDIGPGDEVIVPNLSFIATANAVLHAGATPVFADISPDTLCLDPEDVVKKISSKTKAIMPVHLYGHPAEMNRILEIGESYGLMVIEDAAEAHGAKAHNRRVGSFGICGTFSFYGNKILTTGEGGMITTNDDHLNSRLRHLRDHAMMKDKRYWHDEVGFNYRITNLQAALGCAQLDRIEELLGGRQAVLNSYRERLSGIPGLALNKHAPWAEPVCWLVCMEVEGITEKERDLFMAHLKDKGIDSRPYFYPMSHMPYFNSKADTPVTFAKSSSGLNLPTYLGLEEEQLDHICSTIREYWS